MTESAVEKKGLIHLVGPEATKAQNLNELFAEIRKRVTAAGTQVESSGAAKGVEVYPFALPEIEGDHDLDRVIDIRREIVAKVTALTIAQLKELFDPQDRQSLLRGYHPTPGVAVKYFDTHDLDVLRDDIENFLDPNDPDFDAVLCDANFGAVRLLAEMYNLCHTHGYPLVWFKYFQKLSDAIKVNGGRPHAFASVPWEKEDDEESEDGASEDGAAAISATPQIYRREVVKQRFQNMLAAGQRFENEKFYGDLLRILSSVKGDGAVMDVQRRAIQTLQAAHNAFLAVTRNIKLSPHVAADYWKRILEVFGDMTAESFMQPQWQEAFRKLQNLVLAMQDAKLPKDAAQLLAAIDTFCSEPEPTPSGE